MVALPRFERGFSRFKALNVTITPKGNIEINGKGDTVYLMLGGDRMLRDIPITVTIYQ